MTNTITAWIRKEDRPLFEKHCVAELKPYRSRFLTSTGLEAGYLGGLVRDFVLAKEGIWIPAGADGNDEARPFARTKGSRGNTNRPGNSAYPHGLVLIPYSHADVRYHLRTRTIDQTTDRARVELEGSDKDDFVERAFRTYYSSLVRRFTERDQHILLYS